MDFVHRDMAETFMQNIWERKWLHAVGLTLIACAVLDLCAAAQLFLPEVVHVACDCADEPINTCRRNCRRRTSRRSLAPKPPHLPPPTAGSLAPVPHKISQAKS